MKKTTISITEETKMLMDQLLDIQNIYLMAMTAKTKNCDFGKVDNYNDLIYNYALAALISELRKNFKQNLDIDVDRFGL